MKPSAEVIYTTKSSRTKHVILTLRIIIGVAVLSTIILTEVAKQQENVRKAKQAEFESKINAKKAGGQ
jgi:hypothetical protein